MNPRIIHTWMNTIFIFPIASFRKTLCSNTAQCIAMVAICLMYIGKITKKLYFLCKTSLAEPAFVKMTKLQCAFIFLQADFSLRISWQYKFFHREWFTEWNLMPNYNCKYFSSFTFMPWVVNIKANDDSKLATFPSKKDQKSNM